MIEITNLTKRYGALTAVDDISFSVRPGEVLGFLGPNGAGKSTTMKMITGFLAPTSGSVSVCGHDVESAPLAAKSVMGYLPEGAPSYGEMTVRGFLEFIADVRDLTGEHRRARLDDVIGRLALAGVLEQMIETLSKGFKRRVGLAQALLHDPQVLILDEPTVGLDPLQMREIRALIRELRAEHSIILSTHILPEVQAVCDRVQIISNGRLLLNDSIAGLQLRMRASSLTVALRRPPAAEVLRALPGVQAVEPIDQEGRWRLHYDPERNPAEALAAAAAQQDWGLYELIPERVSLEEVFVDITRSDPTESPAEAAA
jgi:ABC-2 type transport system ATP-binding protein